MNYLVSAIEAFDEVLALVELTAISLSRNVVNVITEASEGFDEKLHGSSPTYIYLSGLALGLLIHLITNTHRRIHNLKQAFSTQNVLLRLRKLPIIRTYVKKKLGKIEKEIKDDLVKVYQNEEFVRALPKRAVSPEILLKKVRHYQLFDTSNWQQGRISGAIYTNNSARYNELLLSVYGSTMWSNPLHADVFAGIRKMEGEIVRMVVSMYNGNPDIMAGSVTSGGTESIFLACKAYRDYAIKERGLELHELEIVAPVTAHAAFEKAARMLGCNIRHIPVDKNTFKVDMKAMRAAIRSNRTFMLVGSAPQFPHGIIDPIGEIAKLGLEHSIPVHVDACLGGFLLPFVKLAGHKVDERFDFTIDGVTSISADTHKYGYAPKGTSVVVYSDRKFIHHQYSIQTDWPGGIYASPSLPGSRPGGLIATCWAAMMFNGLDGYVQATEKILSTTKYIKKELSGVEGLEIMGDPQLSVIALRSDQFDIFQMNSKMRELGWNLNALQFPSAIHLCVTLMHTNSGVSSSFVRDVKAIAKHLLSEPNTKMNNDSSAIYGMAQTIPDRSLVAGICTKYLDGCLGY